MSADGFGATQFGSLLGGAISGNSTSNAMQTATANYIPSETINDDDAGLLSPYPAGQGLYTANVALPASAAYETAGAGPLDTLASDLGVSTSTLLILAAAAVAAWYFMHR